MNREFSPRFRSAAAALRFFFRVSALLCGAAINPRAGSHRMTRSGLVRQPGAFGDYLRIGSCVGALNERQFGLLGEFYGPACFAPRTLAEASSATRAGVPGCGLSGGSVRMVHRAALSALRARLRRRRLLIAAPAHRHGHFSRSPGTWAAGGRDPEKLQR
jgi:hypothetical protein